MGGLNLVSRFSIYWRQPHGPMDTPSFWTLLHAEIIYMLRLFTCWYVVVNCCQSDSIHFSWPCGFLTLWSKTLLHVSSPLISQLKPVQGIHHLHAAYALSSNTECHLAYLYEPGQATEVTFHSVVWCCNWIYVATSQWTCTSRGDLQGRTNPSHYPTEMSQRLID